MMRIAEALDAFRPHRGDAIVVPGRGGRYWVDQTGNPDLDVPLGDPAMGGHAGFALGLALTRPERKLVLFDSEGDIQMSLGMLATIAEQAPANFYHFLLDNECYGTTGGQPVPNAKNIAYDKMALAAGYPRAQDGGRGAGPAARNHTRGERATLSRRIAREQTGNPTADQGGDHRMCVETTYRGSRDAIGVRQVGAVWAWYRIAI